MHPTEQLNAALAGRYAIESLVGEGGMATVYLARDIKHNRKVALKVLKPDLGAVVGVERFLSEIQVTANLQHPNLLPLFDSGAADGLLFYVMPYVEGESLRARLDREKQLPIDDAMHIATAVASALDYAHRKGVIHRDLKPENILLHEGEPLVADFGIALAVSNAGGNRITQTGLSLGTPQYMSPEQATGDRTIDARTDIYSLGAVTYELLTGEAPHTGSTSQAIIARVLTERPRRVRSSRPNVPAHVEGAIERALEKLPADRWATAKEFSEALSGTRPVTTSARGDGPVSSNVAPVSRRIRPVSMLAWALAIAGLAGTTYFGTRREQTPVLARLVATLPESVILESSGGPHVALSRDGRKLVVRGIKDGHSALYIRTLDDPELQLVRGTDSAVTPGFSPDGQWLIFKVGSKVKKLPVAGGTPQLVADSANGTPSWGDDGQIAYERGGAIWLASSDGASHRLVAGPDESRHFVRYYLPEFLPGGHAALITIFRGSSGSEADSARLGLLSLDDSMVTDLGMAGGNPHYASGYIVFARPGGLEFAAPFSLRKRGITGEAILVLQGVATASTLRAEVSVAQNGTLAYRAGVSSAFGAMFVVDRQGSERQLTRDANLYKEPRVSPDGRHIAVRIGPGATNGDLWVFDVATGALARLTSDKLSIRGEWSRDGSRVVYINRVSSDSTLLVSRPWDGNGSAKVLMRGGGQATPTSIESFSPGVPGGWSAVRLGDADSHDPNISIAPTDTLANRKPFVASAAAELDPRLSPNGRILAYTSNVTGRYQVYLQQVPGPGPVVPVSVDGGNEPVWAPDGSSVYFRSASRMMVATVSEQPTLRVTRLDSLFADVYDRYNLFPAYDIFPDGRRFVMTRRIKRDGDAQSIFVVVNWQQLLATQQGTGTTK